MTNTSVAPINHEHFFESDAAASFFNKLQTFNSLSRAAHMCFDLHFTTELAALILEKYNYKHQRPLTRMNWELYAQAMRECAFEDYTTLQFAVLNGVPILVDGQHRLKAMSVAGLAMQFTVKLLAVQDQAAIERVYSTIDSGRKRSPRDKMGALHEQLGLKSAQCNSLNTAARAILVGLKSITSKESVALNLIVRDEEAVKAEMRMLAPAMHALLACFAKAPKANVSLFMRGHVLAVALITMRDQPEKAVQFWTAAAEDDGLRNGRPEKALINWMRKNPVGKSSRQQHEAAIVCWNKFFEGKTSTAVYTGTSKHGSISGSPFVLR